jgi:hypothetical protein
MKNTYAIMELAVIYDSIALKQAMDSRHKGSDLTPKCGISGTLKSGVTHLSNVKYWPSRTDRGVSLDAQYRNDVKAVQTWLRQFVKLSPEILYISSHHSVGPATATDPNPQGRTKFYGGHFAFNFIKDGVELFNTREVDEYADAKTTVKGSRLGENLILLIIDGCNMHGRSLGNSAALEMQKLLASRSGKPIVLGYHGRSFSTSIINKLFLEKIPAGTDFSTAFMRNTEKQNKLIEYWVEAGQDWNTAQAKIMSAVDNKGRIYDYQGKLMKT